MNFPNFDWTTRITLTLALALAAGCAPAMDDNTSDVDGLATAAHTEENTKDVLIEESTKDGRTDENIKGDAHENDGTEEIVDEDGAEDGAEDHTAPPAQLEALESCDVEPGASSQDIAQCVARVAIRGGTVNLPAGEFILSETLALPSGVELAGSGPQTVLSLDAGVDAPVLAIGSFENQPNANEIVSSVSVHSLSIFGNREEQNMESMDDAAWVPVAGIVVRAAQDVSIRGVTISDTISSGVMVDAGSERVSIDSVEVYDSSFDGITVQDSSEVIISKSTLQDNGAAGISFDWGVEDSEVVDSVISANGYTWGGGENPGIYMAMTTNTTVSDSQISENDGNGVVLTNQGMANDPSKTCSSENAFAKNTINSNGQFAFSVTHSACSDNRSVDNALRDNAWGPVFEPSCGQLEMVGGTCAGPGCEVTCAD